MNGHFFSFSVERYQTFNSDLPVISDCINIHPTFISIWSDRYLTLHYSAVSYSNRVCLIEDLYTPMQKCIGCYYYIKYTPTTASVYLYSHWWTDWLSCSWLLFVLYNTIKWIIKENRFRLHSFRKYPRDTLLYEFFICTIINMKN